MRRLGLVELRGICLTDIPLRGSCPGPGIENHKGRLPLNRGVDARRTCLCVIVTGQPGVGKQTHRGSSIQVSLSVDGGLRYDRGPHGQVGPRTETQGAR